MTTNTIIRTKVQDLAQDQMAAFRYLREHGFRQASGTGTRWRDRHGVLASFRNALALAVRAELEEGETTT